VGEVEVMNNGARRAMPNVSGYLSTSCKEGMIGKNSMSIIGSEEVVVVKKWT
jgi:hypothetical protein